MDIPIYLPTTKVFVQTFFLEKVWLEDTLPTYSLDICPKFRSFFFYWTLSLGDNQEYETEVLLTELNIFRKLNLSKY